MRNLALALLMLLSYCGCVAKMRAGTPEPPAGDRDSRESGGAGADAAIRLPFPNGYAAACTQGPGGAYSHSEPSTRFGVDLDTSNHFHEEVYAPAAGTVRVHDDPSSGFGRHVNIDLGDGTYLVLGHLHAVSVRDGAPVAAGTLLGTEGCTGACTGDHVHFDRHEGDAALPAQSGASVPMEVVAEDLDGAPGPVARSVEEFVCGIPDGHRYRSDLAVTCAHPDGTLVKVPEDPRVYRIDDGTLRWIVSEEVFYGYGYDFRDVVTISEEEAAGYAPGEDIDLPGMVDAAYGPDWQLWLFVGDASRTDRYRIRVPETDWLEILRSWGVVYAAQEEPRAVGPDDPLLLGWPVRTGIATFRDGTLLKAADRAESYVVTDGAAVPIESMEAFLLLGFDPDRVIEIRPGSLERHFATIGSCEGQGNVCLSRDRAVECGGMDFGVPLEPAVWEEEDDDPFELHDLFPLDGGELAAVYVPPADADQAPTLLYASLRRGNGAAIPWEVMGMGIGGEPVVARDMYPIPGDRFRFVAYFTVDGQSAASCQDGETRGEFLVFLGSEGALGVEAVSDGQDGCLHEAVIPAMAEYEDDPVTGFIPAEEEIDAPDDPHVPEDPADGDETLVISWLAPFGEPAARVTLSGEYRLADGSYGFAWHELATVHDAAGIAYDIPGAGSGDAFRFSVEFERADGSVSWSCVGPFEEGTDAQGTLQGQAEAEFEGELLPIVTVGDPSGETTGCGLLTEVP